MVTDSRSIEGSEVQQLVPRGPGEVFKQARERAGISLDDVSEFLHLPRAVIAALESDHQDRMPEPTYVKGYIRSYARYLELDPEPLIEGYIKYVYVPPAPPLQATKVNKTQKTKTQRTNAQRSPLDFVLIAFLSCVFVFLSVWWFYPQPTKFIAEIRLMISELVGDADEPISSEIDNGDVSDSESEAEGLQTLQIYEKAEASSPEIATSVADTMADEGNSLVSTESLTSVLSKSPKPSQSKEVSEFQSNEGLPRSTNASTGESGFEIQGRAAPGGDRLTLTFKDHSWTEVYDANKERLLFGLMNSGSVKQVQGTAPFRILLGNSAAVAIEFNGEPYDHSEFERFDKTARFLVSNSAGN
jgi:cytoskeleton protein RodZ